MGRWSSVSDYDYYAEMGTHRPSAKLPPLPPWVCDRCGFSADLKRMIRHCQETGHRCPWVKETSK